jgi:hypothetical protein
MKNKYRKPPLTYSLWAARYVKSIFTSHHGKQAQSEQALAFWRMAMVGSGSLYTSSACGLKEQDSGFDMIHVHV